MKFFTIYDWMTTDLNLKSYELLCYALVYSYSKNGRACADSMDGIAARTGMNRKTCMRVVRALMDRELLVRERDGRAYVYKALKVEPAKAVVTQTETCGEDFEKLWAIYAKGAMKKAEAVWMSMDDEAKGMALAHAARFVRTRDWKYLPDLHNYLKNQQYLEKTEDRLVIDAKSEYMPYVGDSIKYNLGRFLYSGAVYEGMTVYDGYNDDARPVGAELFSDDGASVVWDGKEWRAKNGLR